MKTLIIRAVSAAVAVFVLGLIVYFFEIDGLKFLCYLVSLLAARELTRMLFHDGELFILQVSFAVCSFAVFLMSVLFPSQSTLAFACISILFCCLSLIVKKDHEDITEIFLTQSKGILGFFYVGFLPAMAFRILNLPNGKIWFLIMLAVVFMGDTFAYLSGMMWGKAKIMPSISPKKTIVGSLGGLFGSALAGGSLGFLYLPQISLIGLVALSIFTGVVAQLGDLFESLLKRVADRKDSGTLMPGHGGILDRLDGVLFGAPILLAGAVLLQKLFDTV